MHSRPGSTGSQKACAGQALPPIRTTPELCEFTIFTHECRRHPAGVSSVRYGCDFGWLRNRGQRHLRWRADGLAAGASFRSHPVCPALNKEARSLRGFLELAADRRRGFGSIGPRPFPPLLRTYAGDVRCLVMSSTGDRGGRALTSAMRPSRLRVLATCNWPPLTSISNHPGFQPSAKDGDMAGRVAKRP
jgi:hypothetical protein